jgi:hypothetical protein
VDFREHLQITHHQVITSTHHGQRGRPHLSVDPHLLHDAFTGHRRITIKALAKVIGVHRNTLSKCMKAHRVTHHFNAMSNAELDTIVRDFYKHRPDSGLLYLMGHIRTMGIRIQRRRVRGAVKRVNGLGVLIRHHAKVTRRAYFVARPNALQHGDGYHKLIRWGIVLHGFIEGFARLVSDQSDFLLDFLIMAFRSQLCKQVQTTKPALS